MSLDFANNSLRTYVAGHCYLSLDQSIAALFGNGEQGLIYDPSDLSTLFQDSAGTVPVTGIEQPVGLMLDKRLGLIRGPELVNGRFDSDLNGWSSASSYPSTATIVAGEMQVTTSDAFGRQLYAFATVPGKFYEVSGSSRIISGVGVPVINIVASNGGDIYVPFASRYVYVAASTVTTIGCGVAGGVSNSVVAFDNISVREIPGNHAFQTTATSRPILRQDANGKYYLYTDGIDDFMVTNSIDFTGTDKMTVVTGLRKIGTAPSVPIELSTATNTNAGAFGVYTQAGTNSYSFASRGTGSAATSQSPAAYVPPITNVITGIANISAQLNQLRVNGSVSATVTTSQGSGNFGNYPLYLFRRGGTLVPFNGNFYGLIVRGAETQDALLNPGQKYIAGKTGVSL